MPDLWDGSGMGYGCGDGDGDANGGGQGSGDGSGCGSGMGDGYGQTRDIGNESNGHGGLGSCYGCGVDDNPAEHGAHRFRHNIGKFMQNNKPYESSHADDDFGGLGDGAGTGNTLGEGVDFDEGTNHGDGSGDGFLLVRNQEWCLFNGINTINKIHHESLDGNETLCGLLVFSYEEWLCLKPKGIETKDVDCMACLAAGVT